MAKLITLTNSDEDKEKKKQELRLKVEIVQSGIAFNAPFSTYRGIFAITDECEDKKKFQNFSLKQKIILSILMY